MRWNPEVSRSRDALEDATGQIELGSMARAEKPATPAFSGPDFKVLKRRTTQVRARSFDNEVFGPN